MSGLRDLGRELAITSASPKIVHPSSGFGSRVLQVQSKMMHKVHIGTIFQQVFHIASNKLIHRPNRLFYTTKKVWGESSS